MTAKEMFEKLGYIRQYKTDGCICYRKSLINGAVRDVVFYDLKKQYFAIELFDKGTAVQIFITIELHLAITQQIKELGWIE